MFRRIIAGLALALTSALAHAAPPATFTDAQGDAHGLGYLPHAGETHGSLYWQPNVESRRAELPTSLDLRALGQVAAIKDQGQCGSCWAFSVTGVLESVRMRNGFPEQNLSEQDLVSCATDNYGCSGGFMQAMDYVVKHGLPLESSYPYTGSNSRCRSPEPAVAAKGARWGFCGSPNGPTTAEIKQCLVDFGVLSATVSAGGVDWSNGGHMTGCRNSGVNHMIGLAGYLGDDLIIKNSWSPSWGDHGYGYAKQGCDELASGPESVSFLVVDGAPGPVIPHITLPARIDVHPGTEIALGRHVGEQGVTYAWYDGESLLSSSDSLIYVTPTKDTVYRVKATTRDGVAESSVAVHMLDTEPK